MLHWFLPCVYLHGPPPSRGRTGGGRYRRRPGGGKVAVHAVPPSNLPPLGAFCSRFFERGHDSHVFTRMHGPVAPAACGLTRPAAAPAPAGMVSAAPAPVPLARVRGRSGPRAAGPGRATPPGSGSSHGERYSPAAGAWHAASALAGGQGP